MTMVNASGIGLTRRVGSRALSTTTTTSTRIKIKTRQVPQVAPYYMYFKPNNLQHGRWNKRWFSNPTGSNNQDDAIRVHVAAPLTTTSTTEIQRSAEASTETFATTEDPSSSTDTDTDADTDTESSTDGSTDNSAADADTQPWTESSTTTTTPKIIRNEHKDEGPLGIVEILGGTKILGYEPTAKSGKTWIVNHLRYSSPQRGLQCICILIGSKQEQKKQLPVNKQGERWDWVSPPGPPPNWIFQQGIQYDLEQAKKHRQGRPYGFPVKLWRYMKHNFARHAVPGQVFPDDYIRTLEQIAQRKMEAKQRSKENIERQAKLSKQIKQQRQHQHQQHQQQQQQQNNQTLVESDKQPLKEQPTMAKTKSKYPQSKIRQNPKPKPKQERPSQQNKHQNNHPGNNRGSKNSPALSKP